jgi:tetratricopeptide (TPR) repeat protein
MSREVALILLGAVGFASLVSGCHTCEDHPGSETAADLAQYNYDNYKYDQAKILYSRAVEKCPQNEKAWFGVANSSREYGNNLYKTAADLAGQGKIQEAKRVFKEASDNHALAFDILQRRMREKPEDLAPHYGMGLLYYQRATSVLPFPFPLDDSVNRPRERDLAIIEFQKIVKESPTAWQAHRYLGLALFCAGRMDEGRPHLSTFHDAQQALYERVLGWPGSSDDEKTRKENALRMVHKEIDDIRDVLGEYFMNVQNDEARLKLKKERTPEDEAKLARLKRESLELENIIKRFHLTNLGPVEQELRRRCDDYLAVFNSGKVTEIMGFVAPKQGEEAAVQNALQKRVDEKTQIRKAQYRTIVVSGDSASIALVAEVVSKQGTRPDSQLTMHWKLVGGQWKVSDLP